MDSRFCIIIVLFYIERGVDLESILRKVTEYLIKGVSIVLWLI